MKKNISAADIRYSTEKKSTWVLNMFTLRLPAAVFLGAFYHFPFDVVPLDKVKAFMAC